MWNWVFKHFHSVEFRKYRKWALVQIIAIIWFLKMLKLSVQICTFSWVSMSKRSKQMGFFKFCNHWSVENVETGFFINDLEPVECQKCWSLSKISIFCSIMWDHLMSNCRNCVFKYLISVKSYRIQTFSWLSNASMLLPFWNFVMLRVENVETEFLSKYL